MICSPLAGMSQDELKATLLAAQQAYIELMTGQFAVSFSYTQGDGTKSVTYDKADLQQLKQFIQMLQKQLGMNVCRRRALGFIYA